MSRSVKFVIELTLAQRNMLTQACLLWFSHPDPSEHLKGADRRALYAAWKKLDRAREIGDAR